MLQQKWAWKSEIRRLQGTGGGFLEKKVCEYVQETMDERKETQGANRQL